MSFDMSEACIRIHRTTDDFHRYGLWVSQEWSSVASDRNVNGPNPKFGYWKPILPLHIFVAISSLVRKSQLTPRQNKYRRIKHIHHSESLTYKYLAKEKHGFDRSKCRSVDENTEHPDGQTVHHVGSETIDSERTAWDSARHLE